MYNSKKTHLHRENLKGSERMRINEEIIHAIELLYGGNGSVFCLATMDMRVVWCSDHALSYAAGVVCSRLVCISATGEIFLPKDHRISLQIEDKHYSCMVDIVSVREEQYYLLRFWEDALKGALSPAATRELLDAYSGELRIISSKLIGETMALRTQIPTRKQAEAKQHLQSLTNSIYQLLNQSVRCSELVWYENFAGYDAKVCGAANVSATVRAVMDEIADVTKGAVAVAEPNTEEEVYAPVDAERLRFALLNLFVLLQCGDKTLTKLICEVTSQADTVSVTMIVRSKGIVKMPSMLRTPAPSLEEGAAASQKALLDRFCQVFRAKAEFSHDAESVSCVLTMPRIGAEAAGMTFCAPKPMLGENPYALPNLVLAPILEQPLPSAR